MKTETANADLPSQCSEEVVARTTSPSRDVSLVVGDGGKYTEPAVQVCIDCHDRRNVAASVAVVGRGPDCHDRLLGEMKLILC